MHKSILKFLFLNLGYSFTAVAVFFILLKLNFTQTIPDNLNLLNWDAKWYNSIRESGYIYVQDAQCNLAFFPLFPFLWSLLGLSPLWISLFNGILFQFSFYLLLRKEQFSYDFFLFLLIIPSFIFFYLPYSESLFFLFSTFIICGYKSKSNAMKFLGFFLSSMVRSVSVIFIPAIILTELLAPTEDFNWKKRIFKAGFNCLASLSGLAVIIFIQGLQTGKWFYFTSVLKYWDRKWIIPQFPLTTGNPSKMLGIDGISFIIGLCAIFFCFKWTIEFFLAKKESNRNLPPVHVIFSALFMSAITILDTFHTHNAGNAANLWSINRHLMSTAFTVMFLHWLYAHYQPTIREKLFWSFLLVFGILITGVYIYPLLTLYYVVFFLIFIALKFKALEPVVFLLPLICLLSIQLLILEVFLSFNWVG